jgi:hypothetical protein
MVPKHLVSKCDFNFILKPCSFILLDAFIFRELSFFSTNMRTRYTPFALYKHAYTLHAHACNKVDGTSRVQRNRKIDEVGMIGNSPWVRSEKGKQIFHLIECNLAKRWRWQLRHSSGQPLR